MKKVAAEPYRDIDFSQARRGPVVKAEPGKTKISIRLDKAVIESFRELADQAGGGNYQTLINDALVAYLHQGSMLEAVRQVVREEVKDAMAAPQRARTREPRARGAAHLPATRNDKACVLLPNQNGTRRANPKNPSTGQVKNRRRK